MAQQIDRAAGNGHFYRLQPHGQGAFAQRVAALVQRLNAAVLRADIQKAVVRAQKAQPVHLKPGFALGILSQIRGAFQVVIRVLKYLVSRSNPHGVVAGAEADGRVGLIQGRGLVCRQRPGAGPEHRQANRQQQGGGPQPSAFFGETNGTHKGHSSLVMPGFD